MCGVRDLRAGVLTVQAKLWLLLENISAVRSGGRPRRRINCTDERVI